MLSEYNVTLSLLYDFIHVIFMPLSQLKYPITVMFGFDRIWLRLYMYIHVIRTAYTQFYPQLAKAESIYLAAFLSLIFFIILSF